MHISTLSAVAATLLGVAKAQPFDCVRCSAEAKYNPDDLAACQTLCKRAEYPDLQPITVTVTKTATPEWCTAQPYVTESCTEMTLTPSMPHSYPSTSQHATYPAGTPASYPSSSSHVKYPHVTYSASHHTYPASSSSQSYPMNSTGGMYSSTSHHPTYPAISSHTTFSATSQATYPVSSQHKTHHSKSHTPTSAGTTLQSITYPVSTPSTATTPAHTYPASSATFSLTLTSSTPSQSSSQHLSYPVSSERHNYPATGESQRATSHIALYPMTVPVWSNSTLTTSCTTSTSVWIQVPSYSSAAEYHMTSSSTASKTSATASATSSRASYPKATYPTSSEGFQALSAGCKLGMSVSTAMSMIVAAMLFL